MLRAVLVCQSIPPAYDPDLAFVGLAPDDLSWRARALQAEAEVVRLRQLVEGLAERVAIQSELLSQRAARHG